MDTEELKRLAEANYGWKSADSAWLHTSNDGSAIVGNIDDEHNPQIHNPVAVVDVTQYDGFEGDSLELANFYAAANPAAILTLIAEIDSLRDEINGLTGELGRERKRLDWAVSRESFYDHTTQVFFCDRAFKIPQPQVRIETDNFRATIDELMGKS